MINPPLVSVVIVNWNGERIIKKSIASILEQKYKNIEVIVVDNNSSDRSRRAIRSFKSKVHLVESNENLGFAGGNNLGVSYARGKYVLLFNSDAIATENALTVLVEVLEKKQSIGVVQPKLIYSGNPRYPDGVINSVGCYFTNTGYLYYLGYGKNASVPLYNEDRSVFSAYGACMLIRKSVIDKVGLFDNDFFLYFEETDFCIRVWLAGKKIWYTHKAIVYHSGGMSSRKFGTPQVTYHSFKNRLCSYIKTLEAGNAFKVTTLCLLMSEAASFLYLLFGKFDLFMAVQKAIFWNVFNFPRILQKRRMIQQTIRKVSDASFIKQVTWQVKPSYYYFLFKGLERYSE